MLLASVAAGGALMIEARKLALTRLADVLGTFVRRPARLGSAPIG